MISAVRTSFRPQESKFLTLETGDVMTKAMMCRNCGVHRDHRRREQTCAASPASPTRRPSSSRDAGPASDYSKAFNE